MLSCCRGVLARALPLLGLVALALAVVGGAWGQDTPATGMDTAAALSGIIPADPSSMPTDFPFLSPDPTQRAFLLNAFKFQSTLFAGISGADTEASKALGYLAMMAALIGALLIVFFPKYQRPFLICTWLLVTIILVFAPYGSKMLFYPTKSEDAEGVDCTKTPDQCGFTPQLLGIHLAATLQVIFSDTFRSLGWKGILENVVSEQALGKEGALTAGAGWWSKAKNYYTDGCGHQPVVGAVTGSGSSSDPSTSPSRADPPADTFASYWQLNFVDMIPLRDAPGALEEKPPAFIVLYDDVKGSDTGNGSDTLLPKAYTDNAATLDAYVNAINAIYQEFVHDGKRVVYQADGSVADTINVTTALDTLEGRDIGFFETVMSGGPDMMGPGYFFIRPKDIQEFGDGGFGLREKYEDARICFRKVGPDGDIGSECNLSQNWIDRPTNVVDVVESLEGVLQGKDPDSLYHVDKRVYDLFRLFQDPDMMNMPVVTQGVQAGIVGAPKPILEPTTSIATCEEKARILVDLAMRETLDNIPYRPLDKYKQMLLSVSTSVPTDREVQPDDLLTESAASYVGPGAYRLADLLAKRLNSLLREAVREKGGSSLTSQEAGDVALKMFLDVVWNNTNAFFSAMAPEASQKMVNDALAGATTDGRSINLDVVGNDLLTSVGGWLGTFFGTILTHVLAFFTGMLAATFVSFIMILVDMALMAIIVLTPFMFLMGVLLPTASAGVLTIAVMGTFILKFVPITLIILNNLGGLIMDVIQSSDAASAGIMQSLLVLAMSGLYTTIVGVTFFLMFKMGDPAAVLGRVAALDGKAKEMAEAGRTAAITAAGLAGGAVFAGFSGAGASFFRNNAARLAVKAGAPKELVEGMLASSQQGGPEETKPPLTQEQQDKLAAEEAAKKKKEQEGLEGEVDNVRDQFDEGNRTEGMWERSEQKILAPHLSDEARGPLMDQLRGMNQSGKGRQILRDGYIYEGVYGPNGNLENVREVREEVEADTYLSSFDARDRTRKLLANSNGEPVRVDNNGMPVDTGGHFYTLGAGGWPQPAASELGGQKKPADGFVFKEDGEVRARGELRGAAQGAVMRFDEKGFVAETGGRLFKLDEQGKLQQVAESADPAKPGDPSQPANGRGLGTGGITPESAGTDSFQNAADKARQEAQEAVDKVRETYRTMHGVAPVAGGVVPVLVQGGKLDSAGRIEGITVGADRAASLAAAAADRATTAAGIPSSTVSVVPVSAAETASVQEAVTKMRELRKNRDLTEVEQVDLDLSIQNAEKATRIDQVTGDLRYFEALSHLRKGRGERTRGYQRNYNDEVADRLTRLKTDFDQEEARWSPEARGTDAYKALKKSYEEKRDALLALDTTAIQTGENMQRRGGQDTLDAERNFRSGADKVVGNWTAIWQGAASGFYGSIAGSLGGVGSFPVIGQIMRETLNEWSQAPERAKVWRGSGGFWAWREKQRAAAREGFYMKEMAPLGAAARYERMEEVGAFQAQIDVAREAAYEAVARSRSQFEALFRETGGAGFSASQLAGLGRLEAVEKLQSVRAEANLMQGPAVKVKIAERDERGFLTGKTKDAEVALTVENLSVLKGDLAVKKFAGSFDEMMVNHYGIAEKQYMRGSPDWDATRSMSRDGTAARRFAMEDVDTDYIVGGHLKMVQGKERFMEQREQYRTLVKYRNQSNHMKVEYVQGVLAQVGGNLQALIDKEDIKLGGVRVNVAKTPQAEVRRALEKWAGDKQGVELPLDAIFMEAESRGRVSYAKKVQRAQYAEVLEEAEIRREREKGLVAALEARGVSRGLLKGRTVGSQNTPYQMTADAPVIEFMGALEKRLTANPATKTRAAQMAAEYVQELTKYVQENGMNVNDLFRVTKGQGKDSPVTYRFDKTMVDRFNGDASKGAASRFKDLVGIMAGGGNPRDGMKEAYFTVDPYNGTERYESEEPKKP